VGLLTMGELDENSMELPRGAAVPPHGAVIIRETTDDEIYDFAQGMVDAEDAKTPLAGGTE
jgi:hypothetical protein